MARWVATVKQRYKVSIPYHFTCNYCGEVSGGAWETVLSVDASGRTAGEAHRLAGEQAQKQRRESIREKKRGIERYRRKLAKGKAVTDGKVCRIPLRSVCEHCGKQQMWNPPARPSTPEEEKFSPLVAAGLIGTVVGVIGVFVSVILLRAAEVPLAVKIAFGAVLAVGLVCLGIASARGNRREAAWFQENFANEPNALENLPIIDE